MKKFAIYVLALVIGTAGSLVLAASKDPDKVSPLVISGATTIDATKAKQLFDRGLPFVDVRKDKDWEAGRIPGAIHLELKKIYNQDRLAKVVKKADEVVIYCNGTKCMRSSKACKQAVAWGFTKVYYFRGGFPEWQAADYPAE